MRRMFEQFWNEWTLTIEEARAAAALDEALCVITQLAPSLHVQSIYVGGSFVRRELSTDHSDVDVFCVLASDQGVATAVTATHALHESVQVHHYSISELRDGEYKSAERTNRTLPPGALVREWTQLTHVWGDVIDPEHLTPMSDDAYLAGLTAIVRKRLDEAWGEREPQRLRFLAKQVLHLARHELRTTSLKDQQSHQPSHSSAHFSRAQIAAQHHAEHIAHEALRVLQNPELFANDSELTSSFCEHIRTYLDEENFK